MCPMTVTEAQAYVDKWDHAETKGYAEEFLRELEEDFADCDMMELL